jgi:hypothetical protein
MRQEGSGQRASVRVTDKERLPDETSGLYAELAEEQVFLSHDERKKNTPKARKTFPMRVLGHQTADRH